jgi:hypothetical protein
MELLTNKQFGTMSIDVFVEANNKEFFMTRQQLNEALDYADDKSMAKIISRNKDVIGEGNKMPITQLEGDRSVTREIELFNFGQIFHILRFSRSAKADQFMEFTRITMEQLLTGKADLSFKKEDDRVAYIAEVKNLLLECRALGIPKYKASVLLMEAKMKNADPTILIYAEIKAKEKLEIEKARGRIRERVTYIAKTFLSDDFEEAWHLLAQEMRYEIGVDMYGARRRAEAKREKAKDAGVKPLPEVPSYLDLIADNRAHKAAEKVLRRMGKEMTKKQQLAPAPTEDTTTA